MHRSFRHIFVPDGTEKTHAFSRNSTSKKRSPTSLPPARRQKVVKGILAGESGEPFLRFFRGCLKKMAEDERFCVPGVPRNTCKTTSRAPSWRRCAGGRKGTAQCRPKSCAAVFSPCCRRCPPRPPQSDGENFWKRRRKRLQGRGKYATIVPPIGRKKSCAPTGKERKSGMDGRNADAGGNRGAARRRSGDANGKQNGSEGAAPPSPEKDKGELPAPGRPGRAGILRRQDPSASGAFRLSRRPLLLLSDRPQRLAVGGVTGIAIILERASDGKIPRAYPSSASIPPDRRLLFLVKKKFALLTLTNVVLQSVFLTLMERLGMPRLEI